MDGNTAPAISHGRARLCALILNGRQRHTRRARVHRVPPVRRAAAGDLPSLRR